MKVFTLIWKVVDTLIGIAIRADELAERRRARKKFRDLVDAREKDQKAQRSAAPTVVLRRPPH